MEKQKVAGIFIICVVAFLAGYWSLKGGGASAEGVKEKTLASVEGVSTYLFSTDIVINTSGVVQGVPLDKLDAISGQGAVDVANKRMKFAVVVNTSVAGEVVVGNPEMTVYLIGDTVYFQSEGKTFQDSVPDAQLIWRDRTQVKQQAEILAKSEVTLLPEETVRGEQTYVLKLSPPKKDLVAYIAEQASVGGAPLEVSERQLTNLTGMVEDYSIFMWVGKRDYLPRKFTLQMTLKSGDLARNTLIRMEAWDYGKPVSIAAPEST